MLTIAPEPPIWKAVLGFDFDDTLMLRHGNPRLDPEFFDCVQWVRSNYGAAWGICTGRSLYQLVEGFNEAKFPFLPDFVIAREREIYFPGQFGRWVGHDDWNQLCEKEHKKLFRRAKRPLKKIQRFVEKETGGRWVSIEGDPAGIIAASVDEMEEILGFVEELNLPAEVAYERNGIYLRFSHRQFSKGTCLVESAARWDVSPENILAIGDNYNDLSMLQPAVCSASGCPANSVPEVRHYVANRGGKVASKDGSRGVMEILGHYFDQ